MASSISITAQQEVIIQRFCKTLLSSFIAFTITVFTGLLFSNTSPVKIIAEEQYQISDQLKYNAKDFHIKKLELQNSYLSSFIAKPVKAVEEVSYFEAEQPIETLEFIQTYEPVKSYEEIKRYEPVENNYSQIDYITQMISSITLDPLIADKLAKIIVNESLAQDADPLLVASLIYAESTFKSKARSHAGALGLMQILPSTARYIAKKIGYPLKSIESLKDPSVNVRLGVAYLKYLDDKFAGNLKNTLIAYNWGPGNLFLALKNKARIPGESITYERKVQRNYQSYQKEFKTLLANNLSSSFNLG